MDGVSLKSRAITFAMCAGAVAFILAIVATSSGLTGIDDVGHNIGRALIPAIVCAAMCWASAERAIATTAGALDAAIARLTRAAHGDLDGDIPKEIGEQVPELASAMHCLFQQLSANLASVHRLAMFDALTALPNRGNFRSACEGALAALPAGASAALFFIDLDRFKTVNDTMGHAAGDALLAMVANRLRAVADRAAARDGGTPLVGRLAGDEFTMFFGPLDDDRAATRIAHGVLSALAEPFDLHGTGVTIGASIGIASWPDHGADLNDLMRAADAAMYHAKHSGRGRAEHFTQQLEDRIADRAQLDRDLRDAIAAADQFALAFQPQVSLPDGRIVAVAASLRWRHPRHGIKLPDAFLQRAEETGLIVEIGDWLVAAVAETIGRWARIGIEHRLTIGIPPRRLDHAAFLHGLRAAMLAADAPARLLELEISEALAMHCSDEAIAAIALLRADGATIAIDDFGSGYSNLVRLRRLPVDRIKLDRSLTASIAHSGEARTVAHAVIGLIHGLGGEAVAEAGGEGSAHSAQADVLRVIGCDLIQGDAIAEPIDEAGLLAWLRAERRRARAG